MRSKKRYMVFMNMGGGLHPKIITLTFQKRYGHWYDSTGNFGEDTLGWDSALDNGIITFISENLKEAKRVQEGAAAFARIIKRLVKV